MEKLFAELASQELAQKLRRLPFPKMSLVLELMSAVSGTSLEFPKVVLGGKRDDVNFLELQWW